MSNPKLIFRFLSLCVFISQVGFSLSQSSNTGEDEFEIYSNALNFHENNLNRKADSTLNRLQISKFVSKTSSLSLDILRLKGNLKFHFFQSDSSIYYYRHAIAKAKALKKDDQIPLLYRKLTYPYMRSRQSDSAFYCINEAIKMDSIAGRIKSYQYSLRSKADMFIAVGSTSKALTILDRCYQMAVDENDAVNMQKILLRIGRIQLNVGEYESAESYMNQSLEIGRKNGLDVELNVNFRKTILYTRWEKWEKADSVNQIARSLCDSSDTPVYFSNILLQAGRIAMYTGQFDLAERYGNRAANIRKINRTNDGLAKVYLFKSRLLSEQGEYETANFWADSALFYGEHIFDPLVRIHLYHQKSLVSAYMGKDKEQNEYGAKYTNLRDSISGVENLKAILDRKMDLAIEDVDREKKLLEKKLSEEQSENTRTIWLITISSLGFIALLFFVIYNTKKRNRKKEENLAKEKQRIEEELANKEEEIEQIKETGSAPLEELPSHFEPLSKREKEVFDELVQGLSDKEIAEKLFISLPTVRTHVRHIYEKFHINSRMEAKDISLKYRV